MFSTMQRIAILITCIVVSANSCNGTKKCNAAVQDDSGDKIESVMQAMAKQITVLKANYLFTNANGVTCAEMITADLANSRIDCTEMSLQKKHIVTRWIFSGKETWIGVLRPKSPQILPGAWQMERYSDGVRIPTRTPAYEDYGIDILKDAVIPLHLQKKGMFDLPPDFSVSITNRVDAVTHHIWRSYTVRRNNAFMGELVYEIDLTDGVKMISVTGYNDENHRDKVIVLRNSDFRKIGDIWIPFHINKETFEYGTNKAFSGEVTVIWSEINPPLNDDAFKFVATQTSLIFDVKSRRYSHVEYPITEANVSPK